MDYKARKPLLPMANIVAYLYLLGQQESNPFSPLEIFLQNGAM